MSIIMPFWIKYKGTSGFTCPQKIGIGLTMSVTGMAAAAIVEKKSLSAAASLFLSAPGTLPIFVFLLIPQLFLVGAGEAFIYTGQLDFFITVTILPAVPHILFWLRHYICPSTPPPSTSLHQPSSSKHPTPSKTKHTHAHLPPNELSSPLTP